MIYTLYCLGIIGAEIVFLVFIYNCSLPECGSSRYGFKMDTGLQTGETRENSGLQTGETRENSGLQTGETRENSGLRTGQTMENTGLQTGETMGAISEERAVLPTTKRQSEKDALTISQGNLQKDVNIGEICVLSHLIMIQYFATVKSQNLFNDSFSVINYPT